MCFSAVSTTENDNVRMQIEYNAKEKSLTINDALKLSIYW